MDTIQNSLHPLHLRDLKNSGLSDETIIEAGIQTVRPADIGKEIGSNSPAIENTYRIPYKHANGFCRYKVFYTAEYQGKKPKYLQKKGTGNRLYIPDYAMPLLQDPAIPLYITEGEKKALKACQEELPCIAIGGLWNWSKGDEEKHLLDDFDCIALEDRALYIVPDNDWLEPNAKGERKNLKQAVYEFAYRLIDRGAKVFILELPRGNDKGVDDYLCTHSIEELKALPVRKVRKLTIDKMIAEVTGGTALDEIIEIVKRIATLTSETERAFYINKLSGKTGISKRSIGRDIAQYGKHEDTDEGTDNDIIIAHPSYEVNPQFLSLGFKETVVVNDKPQERNLYIVPAGERYALTDQPTFQLNEHRVIFNEQDRVLISLNDKWNKKSLLQFINHPQPPEDLYREIKDTLKQYVELKDAAYGLIAIWIIATYFHRCFHAFPFLFFYGKKQAGKSRALDILERLSFNAFKNKGVSIPSLADSIDGQRCTFLMDQAEVLSDKRLLELLGILADSYTVGGGKRRVVNITNKRRSILEFETYAPKAFASTKELDTDLKDRTIEITMTRAGKDYPYPEAFLPIWGQLRDELYRLLLTQWKTVKELYQTAGGGVMQRVRELWRPLDTVLTLLNVPDDEKQAIKEFFLESMAETQTGLTELEERLIQALLELLGDKEDDIFTITEIVEQMVIEDEKFGKREQTKWAGRVLKKLNLYAKYEGREKNRRKYLFTKGHVNNIYRRYQMDGIDGISAEDTNGKVLEDANANRPLAGDGIYADSCQEQKPLCSVETVHGQGMCQCANDANEITTYDFLSEDGIPDVEGERWES